MQNEKTKQLHQTVVEAIVQAKAITKNHENPEVGKQTLGEKFSDVIFSIGSSWAWIFVFTAFVTLWVAYNLTASAKNSFDPYPFLLMTFLLAGIAAIQAPLIMMSQHRRDKKDSERLALNLKVDNEILSLHQSITVLMEQQLQQVHEHQLTTIKLLQSLHLKSDQANKSSE